MRFWKRVPGRWGGALNWLFTIGVAVGFILVFEAQVAKPYRIPSSSMEPTLHCAKPAGGCKGHFSDRVVAARIVYDFRDPARGDIAVFKAPPRAVSSCGAAEGDTFVKRVIGLPGEQVSEYRGQVFINGHKLVEPYVPASERDGQTHTWPRLGPHSYFMMGDNRQSSCDSRTWGAVPRDNFIGPVVVTYWPPNRLGLP
jgi:signal peptidase I